MRSFCRRIYVLRTCSLLFMVEVALLTGSRAQDGETQVFEEESDREILDVLVKRNGYDKRIRPEPTTRVEVNVLLHSLSSPDESSLNYEVEFLLYRRWQDSRLTFEDKNRHKYLNGMSHISDVWLPNTYIVKHGSLKDPLVDVSLRIYNNGTVVHIMRRGISINCQGNLKIFPFDNPKCPFAIESVALEEDEMQLIWSTHTIPLTTATSLQSFNAYLIHSEIGKCGEMFTWRGNFSCLHVLLVFTRDKNFYFSTVFVPAIILVASAFISFWLDKGVVPARVMIGVTTMLSFCTTTNNFRSSLPVVSNLTAMNLWDGVCMFFIYSSLLEFVVVNYLYRKPRNEEPESIQVACNKCKKANVSNLIKHLKSDNKIKHEQILSRRASYILQDGESTSNHKDAEDAGTLFNKPVKIPMYTLCPTSDNVQEGIKESMTETERRLSEVKDAGTLRIITPLVKVIGPFNTEKVGKGQIAHELTDESARNKEDEKDDNSDKLRIAWIRSTTTERLSKMTSRELSYQIENTAKIVFPCLFVVFVLIYFIVFAAILPQGRDNWEIQNGAVSSTFLESEESA